VVDAAPRKRLEKKSSVNSIRTIVVYCLIVSSLIIFSLIFKGVTVFLKSTFNEKYHYMAVIRTTDLKSHIISFDPNKKSYVDLLVTSNNKKIKSVRSCR
jgi:hypothetical protein